MLSLKRNINRLDKEDQLFQSALGAYVNAISVIRDLPIAVDPIASDKESIQQYRESLREIELQITQARDAEVLDRSRETLRQLVREYQEKAEAAASKKEEDLREVMEALGEATRVLSQQHSGHADRLRTFTNNLSESEKITDLGLMRRRIVSHVRDLRAIAEQSKRENDSALSGVQSQLAEFSARLDNAERRASLDGLTGLLNRGEGEARLSGLIGAGDPLSAILIDLNGFKRINDTWGHAAGDQVLKTYARILANFVRAGDLVCRWGGDEFLAVLRCGEEIAAQRAAALEPLLRATQKVVVLGKLYELAASAAIGITGHLAGESAQDFVARVDAEMYRDKKQRTEPACAL